MKKESYIPGPFDSNYFKVLTSIKALGFDIDSFEHYGLVSAC